jgi:hypothetical protein
MGPIKANLSINYNGYTNHIYFQFFLFDIGFQYNDKQRKETMIAFFGFIF